MYQSPDADNHMRYSGGEWWYSTVPIHAEVCIVLKVALLEIAEQRPDLDEYFSRDNESRNGAGEWE